MEIISSIILAVLQSILFYGKNIGISMLIFMILGNGIVIYILKAKDKIKNRKGLLLLIPIILLSSSYSIFANKTFYVANIFVEIALELLMFVSITNEKNYFRNMFEVIKDTAAECDEGIVATKEKLKANIKNNKSNNIKKIAISILVVFVIVGVVIILLALADRIFASVFSGIEEIFSKINIGKFIIRIGYIIAAYIFLLSFIMQIQKQREIETKENKVDGSKYSFTIKLLLIALNIVYLFFCYIQIKSLFAKINLDESFNYASYARSGFFELMFVSFINFAIILISSKLNTNKEKIIKVLNIFLVIFTIIIVLSSMYRMNMYEMEYGLTYLRLFVYIILITELIVFVPLVIYILKDDFKFIKWGLIIALAVYLIINFMNLEKIIVSRNINRDTGKKAIDYDYILKIASADSYDMLEEKANEDINLEDKLRITRILIRIKTSYEDKEWQEFNISVWNMDKKDIDIQELQKQEEKIIEMIRQEKELEKIVKEAEKSIYNEIINENEQYIVQQVDRVMGTALWDIIKITNNGREYKKINQIEVTSPSKIEFFENGLGFLERPTSIYCGASELLVTYDSGKTFNKIEFPKGTFTLSDPNGEDWNNCYDYFYLPKKEDDGTLTVWVSGGYEGGYNEGKTRAKYISKDNGKTWKFVSEVYKENI